jgi:hypothetical protein
MQGRADSVVLAWLIADRLLEQMRLTSAWNGVVLESTSRDADRQWYSLVEDALRERAPEALRPREDSVLAFRAWIVVGPSTDAGVTIRTGVSGCGTFGWVAIAADHDFARAPGTWVYARERRRAWRHGRCSFRRFVPPPPLPPSTVPRVPPPSGRQIGALPPSASANRDPFR